MDSMSYSEETLVCSRTADEVKPESRGGYTLNAVPRLSAKDFAPHGELYLVAMLRRH